MRRHRVSRWERMKAAGRRDKRGSPRGSGEPRGTALRQFLEELPLFGDLLRGLHWCATLPARRRRPFPGTGKFWEQRYGRGGTSGAGSYGAAATLKARVLNDFIGEEGVSSVIEFGCGDGNQLALAEYPRYLGLDISPEAVERSRETFGSDRSKSFKLMEEYEGERAELALSLDVIYHIVEEELFEGYMRRLFGSSERYVIIYSSDTDRNFGLHGTHVRHRSFTKWVKEEMGDWILKEKVPGWSFLKGAFPHRYAVDFYIYERSENAGA